MGRRREAMADTALRLAAARASPIRRWAARRAAGRGMAEVALAAAPTDAVVLARLGLHLQASAATGSGRSNAIARAASAAALGDVAPSRLLLARRTRLAREDRRLLARGLALADPGLAGEILPDEDAAARAACALAAGRLDRAAKWLAAAPPGRETHVVAAALAARLMNWRETRSRLNQAFACDGCEPPLRGAVLEPVSLFSFGEAIRQTSTNASGGDGPLISVIIPARNAADTLDLAVGSVLRQSWRALEVVIVDDRSEDATPAIARRLADADPRVRVLANQRASGAYGARNTGIATARGAFVACHDADDWAHPGRLAGQMAALGAGQAASIARYFRLAQTGAPVSPRVFPLVRLSPMASLARTTVWGVIGPFEEVEFGANSEWLARLERQFGRASVARTPAIGFVARWAAGSLSTLASSGMTGEGWRRRLAYEAEWRFRHARGAVNPGASGHEGGRRFAPADPSG